MDNDLLVISQYDLVPLNFKIGVDDFLVTFLEYFKEIKSKKVLIWYPSEYIPEPFIYHNPVTGYYKEFFIELENLLIKNDVFIYGVFGGFFTEETDYLTKFPIKNISILYWPTFLLHYSMYGMEKSYQKSINDISIDTNFNKLFLCLNRKPRTHRVMVVDFLKKYDLFNDGIITWNILIKDWVDDYKFKYWEEELIILDDCNRRVEEPVYFTDELLKYKCLINISCETLSRNNDNLFITEKTYKNLLIGQPYVSLGCQHANKILTNFGFELYDEIIDYSFDDEVNLIDRAEGLVKSMMKISNRDYNEMYQIIKEKVERNRKRAITICENDPYISNEFVELYKNYTDKFKPTLHVPHYLSQIMKNK
jgi:hypothetical protein